MLTDVFFDCDGVLLDSERHARRFLADRLPSYLDDKNRLEDLNKWLDGSAGRRVSVLMLEFSQKFGRDLSSEVYESLLLEMERDFSENVCCVPDIHNALSRIGLRKSVVSNSSFDILVTRLSKANLYDCFEGRIFSGLDVPKPKPDPDVYMKALETLSLDRSRVVVVEDSYTGVSSAIAAGLNVLVYQGVSYNKDPEKFKDLGVSVIFDDMLDLPKILEELR